VFAGAWEDVCFTGYVQRSVLTDTGECGVWDGGGCCQIEREGSKRIVCTVLWWCHFKNTPVVVNNPIDNESFL